MARILTVRVLKRQNIPAIVIIAVLLAVLGGMALAAQDRFTLKVPEGSRFLSSEDMKHGRMSP
jgi:hypothetical protein